MEKNARSGNILRTMARAKILTFAFTILITLFLISNTAALANPAAVYCSEMKKEFGGYEYKIEKDNFGNEIGICVVEGKEFDEWSFFEGKEGKDYSYCEKKGYETKEGKNGGSAICAGKTKTISENGKTALSAGEEKSVEELMDLKDKLGGAIPSKPIAEKSIVKSSLSKGILGSTYDQKDYPFWDWRNPPAGTQYALSNFAFSDTNNGWVTSVKNQLTCGSCWSFATHAAVEAKYEIGQNNSRLNSDLSEQHSVSCDKGCYVSLPAVCQQGCSGGFLDLALKFMKLNGTIDENCFKYVNSDASCSNRCADYANRLWTITDYTTTWPDGGAQTWLTINETKQWLIDYGPMAAGMYMETSSDPGNNIYRCTSDTTAPNHAVLLVGYNDTGNPATSYWICKNSWGTGWGDGGSGFFKLGFNECNFTYEFDYANSVNAPANFKPLITLNSPADGYSTQGTLITFNFSVYNKNATNSTCDLLVNGVIVNSTFSVSLPYPILNGTSSILTYNLSGGSYNWSINCWEKDIGIINSSSTRAIMTADFTPPFIALTSPANTSYNTKELLVNITNSSDAASIWWYNGTTNLTYSSPLLYNFSEGSNTIIAYANDSAGNLNQTSLTFAIDSISPQIAFSLPTNDSGTILTQDYILINVTASDANLANITIRLYNSTGLVNSTNSTTSPLYVNFSTNADTIYYFNATAYDTFGNYNHTETRNVSVDARFPVLTVISPVNNSWYNAGKFNVSINENGLCWYSLNNGILNMSMSTSDNQRFYATNSSLSEGAYNATYYCNDSQNRLNVSSVVFFNIDKTTPTVTLIEPEDGASYIGTTTISFKYEVTDNTNVSQCALVINDDIKKYNSSAIDMSETNSISKSISAGDYDWSINCTDIAGNVGASVTRDLAIEHEDGGSGGGGGGGGLTGTTYTASESALLSGEGYTKALTQNDEVKFSIKGTNHTLKIEKITSSSAIIIISSNPINITLSVGESRKVNLTSKDYYDLYVKLESIASNKANVTIKAVYEMIPVLPAITQNITGKSNFTTARTNETIFETQKGASTTKIIIVIAIIVLAGFAGFLVYYLVKRKDLTKRVFAAVTSRA
ncbi:MAG: C1 family peptidase [Candidatus Pacearchaeota archaeon]